MFAHENQLIDIKKFAGNFIKSDKFKDKSLPNELRSELSDVLEKK